MSADNGIYILVTEGEWRVKELQAVENVDYDRDTGRDTNNPDIQIVNARKMWKGCTVYNNEADAAKVAVELLRDTRTEYGIRLIEIPRRF